MHSAAETSPVGVLYVVDTFLQLGGAERILLRILANLPRERFRPHLIVLRAPVPLETFSDPFPCPYQIYALRRIYSSKALPAALRLRRFLLDHDIRLVHTFFEISDFLAGLVAKLTRPVVLISSRRDMGIARTPLQNLAYRWCSGMFDEIQTVSEEVRRFTIETDHVPDHRVVTVPNGVDLEAFNQPRDAAGIRRRFDLLDSTHVIACTGNIRRIKGIDLLVLAAEQVCRRFPKATFLVFGGTIDAGYRRQIEQMLRDRQLEARVRLVGAVSDVPNLLASCDAFLLPSRSEGLSNALLEAMASSLPCVATRVGGNGELIEDGQTGFLAAPEDSTAMAGRIVEILANPGLGRRIGQAARIAVESGYSTGIMMSRLVNRYNTLLARSR